MNSTKHRGSAISQNFPVNPNHNYSTQSLGGKSTGYQFLDELVPSFLSIDYDGRVIRLDSFSKTISPGCRLGWITAQKDVCEQLFRITDATTQQPSGFVQAMVAQLLGDFGTASTLSVRVDKPLNGWGISGWVDWLEGLRCTYERRMIAMATIFEESRHLTTEFGNTEIFTFDWPMGGMFLWVRISISNHPLIAAVDPKRLMLALWVFCTQQPYRVLAVPGKDFAANRSIGETHGYLFLRFCFAAVPEDMLEVKSRSFIKACQDFWVIERIEDIDHILEEEDALKLMSQAEINAAEIDRESIDEL